MSSKTMMSLHKNISFCSIRKFILLLFYLIVLCSLVIVYIVYRQAYSNHPMEKVYERDVFFSHNHKIIDNNQTSFEWIRQVLLSIPTTLPAPADRHINISYYPYIISEPDKCKTINPFLVLIVATIAAEVDKREAIRQTWGNESLRTGIPIVRLFMLGTDSTVDQNVILKESETHHDIIQKNFQDTYKNLTIKTMMGIEWVSMYCPGVKYIMKTDSDLFVNTERLIDYLGPDLPIKQDFFTGLVFYNHQPHRHQNSKWHMPYKLYPYNVYPTFCSGTGYVFSVDVALKILEASFSAKYVYLEDVFVGICLDKKNIKVTQPLHGGLFNNYRVPFSPCAYNKLITSHGIGTDELIAFWKLIQEQKATC